MLSFLIGFIIVSSLILFLYVITETKYSNIVLSVCLFLSIIIASYQIGILIIK